ncbi:hypothetical protein TNCV_3115101, partial [Trichonephila clavipes]
MEIRNHICFWLNNGRSVSARRITHWQRIEEERATIHWYAQGYSSTNPNGRWKCADNGVAKGSPCCSG